MQRLRVTEIELPSCHHLRYIWFTLPNCVEKGGYVAVSSYNSFFCGITRRNHGPARLYVARHEDEIDYYGPGVPIIEVETIWDLYKLICFDYKRNKYVIGNLDIKEKAILVYLDHKMEANAAMVAEALNEQCGKNKPMAVAAAHLGRMKKKGWVARVPELNAWRITMLGRTVKDQPENKALSMHLSVGYLAIG